MKNSLHCRPVGRIRYLPLLSLIALFTAPIASQTCYYPDGSPSIENDIPCVAGEEGACCPSGWECLTNGLCYLSSESYYGRYTCTDKTWKSTGCTGLCTHDNTATGNEAILNCGGETWCCDANRPDAVSGGIGCCGSGVSASFFQLASGSVGDPTGIGESSIGSSSPSTKPASSPASSQAPSSTTPPTTSRSTSQAPLSSTSKVLVIPPSSTPQSTSQLSTDSSSQSSPESFSDTATPTSAAPSSTTEVFTTSPSSGSSGLVTVTRVVTSPASSSQGPSGTEAPISASTTSSGTPIPTSKSGTNKAEIIAPAVAVPVVAIILAVIGFFLWRNRRNKKRNSAVMSAPSQYDEDKSAPGTQEPYKYNAVEGEETMGNAGYRGVNPTSTHNTQPHNLSPSQAELDGRAISPTHSELAGSNPVDTHFYRPLSYELPGSHPMGGR